VTLQVVEAVFFAQYTPTNFKAMYGRLPTKTAKTYTKDYLQVQHAAGNVLEKVLAGSKLHPVRVVYKWPTGFCEGQFLWYKTRWWLKWPTNKKPLPWTIEKAPTTEVSILGDPTLRVPALADKEYDKIVASGVEPWLIAVKLAGEPEHLHVRTYFRNPTANLQDRALSCLPSIVQQEIDKLKKDDGCGAIEFPPVTTMKTSPPTRAPKLVQEILEALERNLNVLLIGPPGTGKTVALEDLQALYSSEYPPGTVLFDPAEWGSKAWSVAASESRSEALVFHPSYSYENFVAGLYPKSSGGAIVLEAVPGPFICLSHWVGETDRKALLVVDEFNRGPAAAIFGDCLGLLDKDKRWSPTNAGTRITRPYANQPMTVPPRYCADPTKPEPVADEIRLPAGVHIVAAMNSTDRSVAPLDAAMRRRFAVIRVGPDYEVLAKHFSADITKVNSPFPSATDPSAWSAEEVSVLAIKLLKALNEKVEYCLGEDFLLGHALLWNIDAAGSVERLAQLASAVDSKVVSTLRMTFVDQDEALAAVLGVPNKEISSGHPAPPGTVAYWKSAPSNLSSIARRKLVVQTVAKMSADQQLSTLQAMCA
jgi:5-methylcytosine-specific restriction protein B